MSGWTEDHIHPRVARTLGGLFVERVRRSPERPAYQYFPREGGIWETLTWGEMGAGVARWRQALVNEGLQPGDRVAVAAAHLWAWRGSPRQTWPSTARTCSSLTSSWRPWSTVGGREHGSEVRTPLLVIEVLSPSTAYYDRLVKRSFYQRHGVPEYWIVDLDARLVERWRPDDTRPEILTDRLEWQPDPAQEPMVIDLVALFAQIGEA